MKPVLLVKAQCGECGYEFQLPAIVSLLNDVVINGAEALHLVEAHRKQCHGPDWEPAAPGTRGADDE